MTPIHRLANHKTYLMTALACLTCGVAIQPLPVDGACCVGCIEYGLCPSVAVNCANGNCWISWFTDPTCPTGARCAVELCNGNSVNTQMCIQTSKIHSPPCNNMGPAQSCIGVCYQWPGDCVDTNMGCNAQACQANGAGGIQNTQEVVGTTCQ
jgi:hypothetical protein